MTRLASTHDLRPSESRFVTAMQELGFGRFESLQIRGGELVLEPWPTTVRGVKFGAEDAQTPKPADEFALKRQVIELFEYVRDIDAGVIRCLQIRHGLPFVMDLEYIDHDGGHRHA